MILHAPALHLLVVASLAASPPIDPSTCAASDLRCTGQANMEAARHATSKEQKAKHLYRAHRAYLALADEGPQSRQAQDLCRARDLLERARALSSSAIHARLASSTAETDAKFKATGIECPRPHGDRIKRARTAVATTATVAEPPPLLPILPKEPTKESAPPEPTTATQVAAKPAQTSPPTTATQAAPNPAQASPPTYTARSPRSQAQVTPTTPMPDAASRWTPRAWAGLGTVVFGAGLIGGMAASLRGRQAANQAILNVDHLVEAENRHLTDEETTQVSQANLRWKRLSAVAVVTGTAGAAALLTGAVLMATGLRRRVNVSPWGDSTSAGLLLSGRF